MIIYKKRRIGKVSYCIQQQCEKDYVDLTHTYVDLQKSDKRED